MPAPRSMPPSEFAEQMPRMREFAALDAADPRRPQLREHLVLAFRSVVEHLARRHGSGQPEIMDDLRQVGSVALIAAIDRWDPDLARGEFLGYLIPCVRGEMLHWFRDRTWVVRVPRGLNDLGTAITRAGGPLSQELGRAPRPSELAAHLHVDVADVLAALEARSNRYPEQLDATDPETGRPLADRLGVWDAELDQVDHRQALRPLLAALPERERAIIMLRFFDEMSQTRIADELGLSQMHVSRLLTRTLAQLRCHLVDI